MKIGILTFHYAYNFGAVLQAYALQTYLKNLSYDVELLDYHNPKVDRSYCLFNFKIMPKRNLKLTFYYLYTCIYRKYKFYLFKKATNKLLHISPTIKDLSDSILSEKDIIIVGSDQLWNKQLTGNNDPFYWALFTKNSRVRAITYAVCMNTDCISTQDYSFISSNINNFEAVSVRESSLVKTLQPLTKKNINVSLDPTLLIDSSVWKNLIGDRKIIDHASYILVYAILDKKKVISIAKDLAKRNNLPLIVMSPIAEISPFNHEFKPVSPIDFISAIAYSNCVVTSSFHGLAFSIIFHKKMWVLGDSGKNDRMKSLLLNLGLSDRFVEHDINLDIQSKIDYMKVEKKLSALRLKSQLYLTNSLGF